MKIFRPILQICKKILMAFSRKQRNAIPVIAKQIAAINRRKPDYSGYFGTPEGIRTPDARLRRGALCPGELLARIQFLFVSVTPAVRTRQMLEGGRSIHLSYGGLWWEVVAHPGRFVNRCNGTGLQFSPGKSGSIGDNEGPRSKGQVPTGKGVTVGIFNHLFCVDISRGVRNFGHPRRGTAGRPGPSALCPRHIPGQPNLPFAQLDRVGDLLPDHDVPLFVCAHGGDQRQGHRPAERLWPYPSPQHRGMPGGAAATWVTRGRWRTGWASGA